jgi:hypothetical protein
MKSTELRLGYFVQLADIEGLHLRGMDVKKG